MRTITLCAYSPLRIVSSIGNVDMTDKKDTSVVQTAEDYNAARARINELMDAEGGAQGDELEALSFGVAEYEIEHDIKGWL